MDYRTLWAQFGWRSSLDIGLVAILCYQVLSMLKGTRAAQVLVGMLVIFLAYALSSVLELETVHWLIGRFYSSIVIVIIVLFQDDIRRLLTRLGRGPFSTGYEAQSGFRVIQEVMNAVSTLSHDRIGALIVFERAVGLDRLHDHSLRVDGLVTEQLLVCIFQSFSPLHDGAVIIQKNRVSCASAQLPLSKNPRLSKKLGTRHSAAVGISEETDAVVVVVSEETGHISIAHEGVITKQPSTDAAHHKLEGFLLPKNTQPALASWVEKNIFYPINSYSLQLKRQLRKKVQWSGVDRRQAGATTRREMNSTLSSETPMTATQLHLGLGKIQTMSTTPVLSIEDPSLDPTPDTKDESPFMPPAEEHRFLPPEPPMPPPRNISIGGIPLNPPMAKSQKKGNTNDPKED